MCERETVCAGKTVCAEMCVKETIRKRVCVRHSIVRDRLCVCTDEGDTERVCVCI